MQSSTPPRIKNGSTQAADLRTFGLTAVHPLRGPELRILRRLQRDYTYEALYSVLDPAWYPGAPYLDEEEELARLEAEVATQARDSR